MHRSLRLAARQSFFRWSWLCAVALVAACGQEATISTPVEPPGPPADAEPPSRLLPGPPAHLTLAPGAHWIRAELLENAEISADAIVFDGAVPQAIADLAEGEVLVSDWGEGLWRRILARKTDGGGLRLDTAQAAMDEVIAHANLVVEQHPEPNPAQEGELVARRQRLEAIQRRPVLQGTLPLDGGPFAGSLEYVTGSLDLSKTLAGDARFGVDTQRFKAHVADGGVDFVPAVRLELQIENGAVTYEALRVSGNASQDVLWDLEVNGEFSYQRSFAVSGVGQQQSRIYARAHRDYQPVDAPQPSQSPEGQRGRLVANVTDWADPAHVAARLNQDTAMEARLVDPTRPSLHIKLRGRERIFSDITPLQGGNLATGLSLRSLASWLTAEFADLGVDARLESSLRGTSMTVTVMQASVLQFRLAGKQFTVEPRMIVRYEANGRGQGRVRAGYLGDGYVMGGYECRATTGCKAVERRAATLPFSAGEVHTVLGGNPTLEFRAYLETLAVLRDGTSERASVAPLGVMLQASTMVSPPYCPREMASNFASTATREGRTYVTERYSLFQTSGVLADIPGCGVGHEPERTACSEDRDCPAGKVCMIPGNMCVDDSAMRITASWLNPDINLDLFVETPSGAVLSASRTQLPGGEQMTHLATGSPACDGPEGCGGRCEGNLALNCQQVSPTNGACPAGCTLVGGASQETCGGSQVADCRAVPGFLMTSGQQCPSGCARKCVMLPIVGLSYCTCAGTYTANSCNDYTPRESCNAQSGCKWTSDQPASACWGQTLAQCSDVPAFNGLSGGNRCPSGCAMSCNLLRTRCTCAGTSYPQSCEGLAQAPCTGKPGCQWGRAAAQAPAPSCTGGVIDCTSLGKTACGTQRQCRWQETPRPSAPFLESAMFPLIEDGTRYRVWIVNRTQNPSMAPVPYTLQFQVRDRESFELRGEVEFAANSRTVFFDYRVPPASGRPEDPNACLPVPDGALCQQQGVECGLLAGPVVDNCGQARTGIFCGQCPSVRCEDFSPANGRCPLTCRYAPAQNNQRERCEGGLVQVPCQNNACQCSLETDADLCRLNQKECGAAGLRDSCGVTRQVNCGQCPQGIACSQYGRCCQAPSDAQICAGYQVQEPVYDEEGNPIPGQSRLVNMACGTFSVVDDCGNTRQVNCGDACATLNGSYRAIGPYYACQGNVLQVRQKVEARSYTCGSRTSCSYTTSGPQGLVEEVLNPNHTDCAAQSYYTPWTDCAGFVEPCGERGKQTRYFYEYGCSQEGDVGGCGFMSRRLEERTCARSTTGKACGPAYHQCLNQSCQCLSPTDQELCATHLRSCGTLSIQDPCTGQIRNVPCGICPDGKVCTANGQCA